MDYTGVVFLVHSSLLQVFIAGHSLAFSTGSLLDFHRYLHRLLTRTCFLHLSAATVLSLHPHFTQRRHETNPSPHPQTRPIWPALCYRTRLLTPNAELISITHIHLLAKLQYATTSPSIYGFNCFTSSPVPGWIWEIEGTLLFFINAGFSILFHTLSFLTSLPRTVWTGPVECWALIFEAVSHHLFAVLGLVGGLMPTALRSCAMVEPPTFLACSSADCWTEAPS